MKIEYAALPLTRITVAPQEAQGPLEAWRHTVGHGGINALPLPPRVVAGARALRPRLIRIFLQEFFRIYPAAGRFDWTRLDPYMDALAQTGAQVVAAITIKPQPLFPTIDHRLWQPRDTAEWQKVVAALVRRYSVERPLVTHWEIGNETDIGEDGGSPYLIPDPDSYTAFYKMTVPAVLAAFPGAKVGGPAACWVDNEPLPGWVSRCRDAGLPLDFVSWHLYSDDAARHASGVEKAKRLLADFPGKRPEMLVTEWSNSFERASVEEQAFQPRRAALLAASILAMRDAGLDWSFYYHLWDQVCDPADFAPFFSEKGVANMVRHWNEVPHRFGLFGVGGEVRPQYFVYRMLSQMGEERIRAEPSDPSVRVLAARDDRKLSVLAVNVSDETPQDRLLTLAFVGRPPGPGVLSVHRIDAGRRWREKTLALLPVERRAVATLDPFECQVFSPADSVTLVTLEAPA